MRGDANFLLPPALDAVVRQRAYHSYQNCGLRAARNLFASGF